MTRTSKTSVLLAASALALTTAQAAAQTQTTMNDGDIFTVDASETVTSTSGPTFVLANDDTGVMNAGTVSQTSGTSTILIEEDTNGAMVINNGGTITGDSRVVDIRGDNFVLQNSGTIRGTSDQRNGTIYADEAAENFLINNSGTIDAGAGNNGAAISVELADEGTDFTILNSGTIAGRGNAGAGAATAGDGIRLERSRVDGSLMNPSTGLFTGEITNSGTISSEGANGTVAGFRAVNGTSFQGELNNEEGGVISGVQNGVYFGNPTPGGGGDHTGGVVNNAGTISSGSRAFNIDGTGLTLNNSGSIVGTGDQRNGTVYADGTATDFTVNNSGLIDAGEGNIGSGYAGEVSALGNVFTFTNSGTIQGRGQGDASTGAAGDGFRVGNPGNTGFVNADITNSGTIDSESNVGTAGGFRIVDNVAFQDSVLTNEESGTISGVRNGVYFGDADHAGGVVNNAGTITSDSRAFNIDGTGLTLNNSGSILGTGDQRNGTVYADSTATDFSVVNSGTIDAGEGNVGSGFAIEVGEAGNTFSFDNSGTIQGRGQGSAATGAAGDGFRVGNPGNAGIATADITNSGIIASESNVGTAGGFRAVDNVGFQGTLTNEEGGTISGVRNGVYFGDADHTGGVVNNAGTISSDSRAFNIDGTGLTLNNSGSILGTGDQRNGTIYADGTATNYAINNTGTVDAGQGNNGSAVSLQLGAAAGDVVDLSIDNAGTFKGRGSNEAAGLRLFAGAENVQVNGAIVNTGQITSETTAGFLVQGVSYNGTFTNEGTVSGPSAIDASTAIGSIDVVNGGTFIGDSELTSFDDSLRILAGSVIQGDVAFGAGDDTLSVADGASGNTLGVSLFDGGVGNDTISFDMSFGLGDIVSVVINDAFENATELAFRNEDGSRSVLVFRNFENFGIGGQNLSLSQLLNAAPVPIPAALPLFASALIAGGAARRRAKRKQA